jgi:ABC-2 type transport system ATP-binding protein
VIEAEQLTRRFGGRVAVADVSFRVAPGEIVGLLGPNGAGKTTTLRMLTGILRPDGGRARIAGHDVAAAPLEAKVRLAFVPDEPRFFDYLTVEEHLRLVARLYGVADVAPALRHIREETTVGGRLAAFPGELSRGMRQELALACALLRRPAALLLDEPLTGLDPIAIRRTKDVIRAAAAGGMAILLSSHLLPLVTELCQRIVVLRGGRAIASGSIGELAAGVGLEGEPLEELFVTLLADEGRR